MLSHSPRYDDLFRFLKKMGGVGGIDLPWSQSTVQIPSNDEITNATYLRICPLLLQQSRLYFNVLTLKHVPPPQLICTMNGA